MRLPLSARDRRTGLTGLNAERLGRCGMHTGTHALAHSGPGNVCSGAVVRADSVEAENDAVGSDRRNYDVDEPANAKSIALSP